MPVQVLYTNDSSFLLSGARQDPSLLCWDLRMTGDGSGPEQALYCMERDTGSTNQRVAFSLEPCGRHVATGGCGGAARVGPVVLGAECRPWEGMPIESPLAQQALLP